VWGGWRFPFPKAVHTLATRAGRYKRRIFPKINGQAQAESFFSAFFRAFAVRTFAAAFDTFWRVEKPSLLRSGRLLAQTCN
jgi:hypothetical protein